MNEFATLDFILSFSGMVIVVTMLTQVTKRLLDKLVKNKTKYLVYLYSLLLCVVAGLLTGDISTVQSSLVTMLLWFINSAAVWLAAMKAFEEVAGDTDGELKIDTTDPHTDRWLVDLDDDMPTLKDKGILKLRINAKANLRRDA